VSLTIFGRIDERIGQSTHIGPIQGEANLYPDVSFVLGSNA